jgi:FKBP-type peptidyl-prolyl cis-trans isomerase
LSVKNNSQRVLIFIIVGVFFLTALASSGFALYDAFRNKDSASNTNDVQKQLEELQNQQANKPKEGALEGTKLSGFTPVAKVDTLQKIDLVPGTGAEVAAGATVTAHYTGALAKDGTIFQSSKDTGQPFTSPLSNLIPGWQEGIPGMKVGGTRRLVIPAAQAYGAQAQGNIPANSDLVFDIEMIETK